MFILFIDELRLTHKSIKRYRTMQTFVGLDAFDEKGEPLVVEIPNSPAADNDLLELNWKQWMRKMDLYPVGLVYMLARLANNVFSSTLPFYLTTVLAMGGVSSTDEATERTPW